MRRKRVLIVEDEPGVRATYKDDLTKRGFDVFDAGTVADTRYLIKELGQSIDLALLDMRLNDKDEPNTNGADLGRELRDKCENIKPEFLIRSAHADFGYYESAFELGAAAYMSRNSTGRGDVIRYVRALMLKHYLKAENPDVAEGLRRITATTKNTTDSIRTFCERILAPTLADCLGAPFILLLTDKLGTQNCAGTFGAAPRMPLTSERIYHVLQYITHGNADPLTPYVLDASHIRSQIQNKQEEIIVKDLDGAAFVSLAKFSDDRNYYRLSLGIMKAPTWEKFPEDPGALASVVARYVQPVVSENFTKILVQIDTKRKTTLDSTSQLCLFQGQDLHAILAEGVAAGDLKTESQTHQRLYVMADDLEDTGHTLMNVSKFVDGEEAERVRVAVVVKKTWEELKDLWALKDINFTLEGECSVMAAEQDLMIITSRILQWMAQRKAATEPPYEPTIIVRCDSDDQSSLVIFEDRSQRLPRSLRERLFEPFTLAVPSARHLPAPPPPQAREGNKQEQEAWRRPSYLPLYLARTLVEEKYWGWLEDRSDQLEGDEVGHRFVMHLHRAFEPETMNAAGG